jgi:hypothetical protein
MEGTSRLSDTASPEDGTGSSPGEGPGRGREGWVARHDLAIHLLAGFVVAGCLTATWWQVDRALGGNGLSWAYVFEWPFFAAYAAFTWHRLRRERTSRSSRRPARRWFALPGPTDDELAREADRLAAYNDYLASLAATDPSRRSGGVDIRR